MDAVAVVIYLLMYAGFLLFVIVALLSLPVMLLGGVFVLARAVACRTSAGVSAAFGRFAPGLDPPRNLQLTTSRARAGAAAALAESYAAGCLDLTELEERTGDALRARTRGELARVCADLPVATYGREPGGPLLAAVGGVLVILGPPVIVRLVGAGLVLAGIAAAHRVRVAVVAFAAGLLVLVSLPASIAVGAGGLWSLRRIDR